MSRWSASQRGVLARLRRICLALPEVTEIEAWGHPVFRAGKRSFAAYEPVQGRPSIAVKVTPPERQLFLDDERFFATPYGARGGWVSLWADGRLDWPLIEDLVAASYRQVALKRMLRALDDGAGERDKE